MKNFDEVREARKSADRTFQIGGELFVRKVGVKPEVIAAYDQINMGMGATETLNMIDEVVLDMIEDGGAAVVDGDSITTVGADGHARYRAIRERDEDVISLADMQDLVAWLIEEETSRTPTQLPSPSPPGPVATATS